MSWQVLNNKQKIVEIINYLITKKTEIKVRIEDGKTPFTSRVSKISQGDISSSIGRGPELIIEKLKPEKGNSLIQSFPQVVLEFFIKDNLCECNVKYNGISSTYPYFGFIVSFPDTIRAEEKRKEERITYEIPEFVSVEFRLGKKPKKDKVYSLNVLDCSKHGLGLLVAQKDFDLLEILNKGDKLHDVTFFATWAMIKVDGKVKHKTRIEEGKYKGCYLLGIESPDIIESCKPKTD